MTRSLNHCAALTGAAELGYQRGVSEFSTLSLQLQAGLAAARDAGVAPAEIDGVIAMSNGSALAEDFVQAFGIRDLRFSAMVPMGGASPVAALQLAAAVIQAGICRHVLLPTGRDGRGGDATARIAQLQVFRGVAEFEMPLGAFAAPQLYAAMARRHMHEYGTRSTDFAEIAVAMRHHASTQPNALMRRPMTIDDHQNSRMVADPLRLLDCCIDNAGAAAVLVSAPDAARDLRRPPVWLMGAAEGHPDSPLSITQRPDLTRLGAAKAADRAFAMAGIGRGDIDVACLYDCFTYIVLCQLEDLGFCAKGEGGPFVRGGALKVGGRLPVNPHGGAMSQAHMVGMNHIVEMVHQLRGEAANQVPGARHGLVSGYGDLGDGSVAILCKDTA
ncbi:thiolase C-terminal domain-containing protein [Acidovorax sp. SDU_ACID1]|uniref:thiolase C-terminal domain-containing protein n=1 Tax=Acidovorax sp. SDU_ACID1 TaxID=3136632 RepID=UPI003873CC19